jgi:signal transduction histidine kinase
MVKQLSRKLIPLSTGIALLIAVLAPVTFWLLAHRNLDREVSLYAEDLAEQLQQIARESPSLWKYQTYKFTTIAEGFHPTIDVIGFRILDEKGELISGRDYRPVRWEKPGEKLSFTEEFKSTRGTAPIHFNDRRVGTIEILADDASIVWRSVLLFGFSSLIGIALAVLVYRFPVRVVRKMEGEIGELIADLRQSDEAVRRLNTELELKVEERTRELVEAQETLVRKEKLAIIGQLSGSVGHELRNPLGVMNNAIYFLKMVHTDADTTTREYLEIIKLEIDNCQRIITDLLDFARTKMPQTQLVPIRELLDASLEKCVLPDTVVLQTELPDSLQPLKVDAFQIGQVFQNLIANGVQAMPEGGSVRISARHAQGPGTRDQGSGENQNSSPLNPYSAHDFVEISVTDTGEGISPENLKKLFQPLFTTKAKGIGLGLVVCKNLVEANGGWIDVASRSGEGTTFTVTLPVDEGGKWEKN